MCVCRALTIPFTQEGPDLLDLPVLRYVIRGMLVLCVLFLLFLGEIVQTFASTYNSLSAYSIA